MFTYLVTAGWCEGREEFRSDDTIRFENDNYDSALMSYHDIWLPDLRYNYQDWDAFCHAEDVECWKSIALLKDGEVVAEFTEYEYMDESERPTYPEIKETFKKSIM